MPRVLVIEDEVIVRKSISAIVAGLGARSAEAGSLGEARALLDQPFDLALLDLGLPDGDGMELLRELGDLEDPPEVIVFTGHGGPDGAEIALKRGVWDFLVKPLTPAEITATLRRALDYRLQRKQRAPTTVINRCGIVGSGPEMTRCMGLLSRAAASDASVLITGETGTGKELLAKAVHANSDRQRQRFVTVDCAALTETLVESILFGSERGAYTGADRDRRGLLVEADGGTLFLDEVGEMSLAVQKTFLRALQEKRVRPIGSSQEIHTNFRLVSATNRSLDGMVGDGTFREDLLFRLRGVVIDIPPLRSRTGGLRELVVHFLERLAAKYKTEPKGFTIDFLDMLSLYNWPGNVRELMSAVEHAVSVGASEPILYPIHLPLNIRIAVTRSTIGRRDLSPGESLLDGGGRRPPVSSWKTYRRSAVEVVEQQYLKDLTEFCDWDIQRAAVLSGLGRARLYEMLKKHGLSRSSAILEKPDKSGKTRR